MSVALLLHRLDPDRRQLIPVATQADFEAHWLPGARALGLGWVELMATGFDVTPDIRDDLVAELGRLRAWMAPEPHRLDRLDRLVAELTALRFEPGASAFLG